MASVDRVKTQGTTTAVDPARDFLEFWRNYFEQTAIQTRILLESMQGGKSLDQMHSQWLGSLSQRLEGFMRTPAFLEVLKQTIRRMVDLKVAQDQMTHSSPSRAGLPMAGDVTGVFERVHSAEHTVLTRLDPARRTPQGDREGGCDLGGEEGPETERGAENRNWKMRRGGPD